MEHYKGKPIMDEEERMYAIEQLGYDVVLNTSAGKDLISTLMPDVIAIGSDWARKDYLTQIGVTQDWLDKLKIMVCYIPYVQKYPISSTELKRRIRES